MSRTHGRLDGVDEHAALEAQRRPDARTRGPGPDAAPAVTTMADPRLAGRAAPAAGLLALQRSAGNAAVTSLVGDRPPVQRAVEIDELTTRVGTAPGGGPEASEAVNPVTSSGGTTTISGAQINLDSAMTSTAGVIRAGTIVADNVVASSYTPGAGNVW